MKIILKVYFLFYENIVLESLKESRYILLLNLKNIKLFWLKALEMLKVFMKRFYLFQN